MRIDPYLMFNGQCEAAFKLYQQCLGGTIKAMLKFSDAPKGEDGEDAAGGCGPLTPGGKRIMHACLSFNDQIPMASDTPPNYPYEGIKGCLVSLTVDSIGEPNASSPRFPKMAQCRCRSARPSGLPASACSQTNSACPG